MKRTPPSDSCWIRTSSFLRQDPATKPTLGSIADEGGQRSPTDAQRERGREIYKFDLRNSWPIQYGISNLSTERLFTLTLSLSLSLSPISHSTICFAYFIAVSFHFLIFKMTSRYFTGGGDGSSRFFSHCLAQLGSVLVISLLWLLKPSRWLPHQRASQYVTWRNFIPRRDRTKQITIVVLIIKKKIEATLFAVNSLFSLLFACRWTQTLV